jgi:hypothetical protein
MNAAEKISEYITRQQDWRGAMIGQIRELIHDVEPGIIEEWKWNSPVWSHHGMVCSAGAFKKHVSLTFFRGSTLEENTSLFNSSSDSKNTRSVQWKEGSDFDSEALRSLLTAAIHLNRADEK